MSHTHIGPTRYHIFVLKIISKDLLQFSVTLFGIFQELFCFFLLLSQENPGHGSSDGVFGKQRFFQCGKDCAVFVSVNKLKFDKDLVFPKMLKSIGSAGSIRQSFIESDLKTDMEVYVSTKKGSKEEYVKGKIIYIGKPKGEAITYVGVELVSFFKRI